MRATLRRLLIPDPNTPQSYDIILGCAQACETIVAVVPHSGALSRLFSFAANSRRVSKVVRLQGGVKAPQATGQTRAAAGEAYLRQILEVCERERIDLLYPSSDDNALFFAEHAEELRRRGILLPVNEPSILRDFMGKLAVVRAAEGLGIPCPQTLALDDGGMAARSDDARFPSPWLVKPRFGSAGRGIRLLRTRSDFERWLAQVGEDASGFVLQEYVPGDTIVAYRFYMTREGALLADSCTACRRPELPIYQTRGFVFEDAPVPSFREQMVSLLRGRKYVGYGHAQFKVDRRDGVPKLLEINARMGSGTWTDTRKGFNAPLANICLFEGNEPGLRGDGHPAKASGPCPAPCTLTAPDTVFVSPMQDLGILMVYALALAERRIAAAFGRAGRSQRDGEPGLWEVLRHYWSIYFDGNKRREYDNCFAQFTRDPAVGLSRWGSFIYTLLKTRSAPSKGLPAAFSWERE